MWKQLNSPIVITAMAIAAIFVLKATSKPRLAQEIRGVYQELNDIVQDGASDAQKSQAIQKFAQEIGKQIREGFSSGFTKPDSQREDTDKTFLETKAKIEIKGFKYVQPKWKGREEFLFIIRNNSDQHLSQLKLNFEYYKNGELIDCANQWISEFKFLEPNQEIAVSKDRSFPNGTAKEEYDLHKSDQVKIKVTSFNFKEIK